MKQAKGFTVIELLVVIAFIIGAGVLFFVEKNQIEQTRRDTQRKVSINAMYYALEEVYYKQHQSYPRTLDATTLPSIDPALFTDPYGVKLGQTTASVNGTEIAVQSNYRYEPTNCDGDTCKSYTLRASLENEGDFVKTSQRK